MYYTLRVKVSILTFRGHRLFLVVKKVVKVITALVFSFFFLGTISGVKKITFSKKKKKT